MGFVTVVKMVVIWVLSFFVIQRFTGIAPGISFNHIPLLEMESSGARITASYLPSLHFSDVPKVGVTDVEPAYSLANTGIVVTDVEPASSLANTGIVPVDSMAGMNIVCLECLTSLSVFIFMVRTPTLTAECPTQQKVITWRGGIVCDTDGG